MMLKESWAVPVAVAVISAVSTISVAWITRSGGGPPNPEPVLEAIAQPTAASLLGSYKIVGTNPQGGGYRGTLEITSLDSGYQFMWNAADQPYIGIGVLNGDHLAVGWGSKQCGAALYQINPNQSLDGQWVAFGQSAEGLELALPLADAPGSGGLDRTYEITGKDGKGQAYRDTLTVDGAGLLYKFSWQNLQMQGPAIANDGVVAVGFGPEHCHVVLYKVQADGSLSGLWSHHSGKALGTEEAIR